MQRSSELVARPTQSFDPCPDNGPVSKLEAFNRQTIGRLPQWRGLPRALREEVLLASRIFPFRVSRYVCDELIDWRAVPDDPIFRLLFPMREMLPAGYAARLEELEQVRAPRAAFRLALNDAWAEMNPHPAGQTDNVPTLDGEPVDGLQHKYRETVLVFPREGQTCHAHCTYCFRAPQFLPLEGEAKFQVDHVESMIRYLKRHEEVSSVLITGGDPMVMRARSLTRYIEPLLELEHITSIRIGSKSLGFYPQVVTRDVDAGAKLRLFERITRSGRHLAFMTQFSHPREMETSEVERAIAAIRSTGGVLRSQSPVLRRINDRAEDWRRLWDLQVKLGVVPYYFFQARNTGSEDYFQLSLSRALDIFQDAYRQVTGLGRTVRGVVMSAYDGKVQIVGRSEIAGEPVFVLKFLQARDPDRVGDVFFARQSETAKWVDELELAS
ncbi:MAG: 4Fe-4S cluster-binding domain-containing protein [Planctomycetota bacterium]